MNSLDLTYFKMNSEMYKEKHKLLALTVFSQGLLCVLFYWTRDFHIFKEVQLLLKFYFFFAVVFLCSCISVLLVIFFFRDEVLGTTALEGPLVAGLLLAFVLFKVAGGVGRIFAGVYVFKDIFLLITGLEREAVEEISGVFRGTSLDGEAMEARNSSTCFKDRAL